MEKIHSENRRKYLRYRPDHYLVDDINKRAAEITGFVDIKQEERFDPQVSGLLTDKSHAGCSLAVVAENRDQRLLTNGVTCVIKAGPLAPLKAKVRWRKEWDEGMVKIGFEFLE